MSQTVETIRYHVATHRGRSVAEGWARTWAYEDGFSVLRVVSIEWAGNSGWRVTLEVEPAFAKDTKT